MNVYVDSTRLQVPTWRGQQLYIYKILMGMAVNETSHEFHLHFDGRERLNRAEPLLKRPRVTPHFASGKIMRHISLPYNMLATGSKVFYRMARETKPLRTPMLGRTVALVLDNGMHMCPDLYGNRNPKAQLAESRRGVHNFDHIITISNTVKQELLHLFDLPDETITVAPPALYHNAAVVEVAAPPGLLPTGRPFILAVNPGSMNKNSQQTLGGFEEYIQNYRDEDTVLILAGDLKHLDSLIRSTIAENPLLRNRVICLGYVTDSEMRYLYKNAQLSLFMSRYEGFGMPLLESMAASLPQIVSNIPVFQEVCGDGPLYVDLDDNAALGHAIHRCNTDSSLRNRMIASGLERVDKYSWETSAVTTLGALVSVAER